MFSGDTATVQLCETGAPARAQLDVPGTVKVLPTVSAPVELLSWYSDSSKPVVSMANRKSPSGEMSMEDSEPVVVITRGVAPEAASTPAELMVYR